MFPANNIWNTPVDQLPVSSLSSTYVNTIGAGTSLHPDFGTVYDGAPNGIPYVMVSRTQTNIPPHSRTRTRAIPGPTRFR